MSDFFSFSITILSFVVSIIVAHVMLRHNYFSYLSNRSGRFGALDGLRGFLAISVFFHHFIITWYWKNNGIWVRPPEDFFENYGKVGVAIFFMITGFLFVSKLLKDRERVDWLKLFEGRIFRIFPLYIFALLSISIVVFYETNFQLNVEVSSLVKQYIKWGLFHGAAINNYANTKIIIAQVDWTLKYEFLFYIILPVLAYFVTLGKAWVIGIITGCFVLYRYPVSFGSINSVFFILFAVGGIAACISSKVRSELPAIKSKLISTISLTLIIFAIFYPYTFDPLHVFIISIFFILVALGNDLFGLFSLKQSVLLGEVSYSIYLLHGIVLYAVFSIFTVFDAGEMEFLFYVLLMPLICMLVVLVSVITFVLVEKPSISFGRKYMLSSMLRRANRYINSRTK